MLYPSLALEMVRIYSNTNKVVVQNSETGVDSIKLADLIIPTDRYARMNINFRGPSRHFYYISASDIIQKKIDPSVVQGKFVLIGTSAVGLADLKPTPFDTVMPGVEIHANMIDTVLANDMISTPHNIELIDLTMIVFTVILSALFFYLLNGWLVIPLLVLFFYGFYRLFYILLFEQGIIVNILMPVIALFATMLITLLLRYLFTSRQKQQLQKEASQLLLHYRNILESKRNLELY